MSDFHEKTCGTCKHFMPYSNERRSGRCKKRPFIRNRTTGTFTDTPLVVYFSRKACKDYEEGKQI